MNIYKRIFKSIKKHNTIVIARHIGPDPDALASQIALRDIISNTFPNKKVLAVGHPASKFRYLGVLDKQEELDDALLIVLDVPDQKRVDVENIDNFKHKIKIDHHPFVEKFCDIEWIDDTSSSTCQLIIELVLNTKLEFTKESAEKLYIGLIADTNRFLFSYTTPKTFELVSELIKETNIDFTSLYDLLYLRPLNEVRFQGYIANNLTVTENGLAYLILSDETLKEFNMDASTAGNMVNNFNYINEIITWVIYSYDAALEMYRGSVRSRGPIINDVAANFSGGGHIYASGVRIKELDQIYQMIEQLDNVCKEYKSKE